MFTQEYDLAIIIDKPEVYKSTIENMLVFNNPQHFILYASRNITENFFNSICRINVN